jgi:hypothetical protein
VERKSSPFREAGALNRTIIDSLQRINPAKVITMGDLNDGPYNKSVKLPLAPKPLKRMYSRSGFIIPLRKWPKEVWAL